MTTTRTMCPMNCHPTLCGMRVDIEDRRLVAVHGDPENPESRGFLCIRGRASREIIDNPRRLLHPLVRRRRDADWERAAWPDALDLIADRMRRAGAERTGLWSGHGLFTTNYGTRVQSHLLRRLAHLWGCQWWNPTMICWGLGAFGLGLTGLLEVHTADDLAAHARLVLVWGANLASQPHTARALVAARRRGARVVVVDVRATEAARHADEVVLVRPGSDAALALGLMHVLTGEGLVDRRFVDAHTVGFEELARHVAGFTPAWTEAATGVPAARVAALARTYAATRPAMVLLGGSSMHKGPGGWQGARAIACLPALTGNVGVPGAGFGPRHGGATHGQALASIVPEDRLPPGARVPNQMARVTEALLDGRVAALLLFGTDMLSSFADSAAVARGLARAELVVVHDLFMNDTARRAADVVLPSTAWLEEPGCKSTNTHLYLMPKALDPPGEARSAVWVMRELAARLGVGDFYPWADDSGPLDAILDHPSTGHATVAALGREGGIRALRVSHVAHPDLRFPTPSGRIELVSERARQLGLSALPDWEPPAASPWPLRLAQGRTLGHFHAFYDQGRALPTLAAAEPGPEVWISAVDAAARGITEGARVSVFNQGGALEAAARVSAGLPAGTAWIRDGWAGLNALTAGAAVLPDAAVDAFGFSGGQAAFDAGVDVLPSARQSRGPR